MTTPESTTEDLPTEAESSADDDARGHLVTGTPGIESRLAELTAAVDGLRASAATIAEFQRLRARDNELVNELHRADDELQKDQLTRAMMPLFRGFIRRYDLMTDAPDADGTLQMLLGQLRQILDLNGVTVYEPKPGDAFDSTSRSAHTVPTSRRAGPADCG